MDNTFILMGKVVYINNNTIRIFNNSIKNNNYFTIYVSNTLFDKIINYIKENNLICVKGYLENNSNNNIELIADKITVMTSKNN